jgi:adenosine kinase
LAINLAAVFVINFFWEKLQDVLPYADFVIGNEDEAAAYAEKAGWEKSDLQAAALKIAALPKISNRPRVAIFTQGKNPTIVATQGKVEYVILTNGPTQLTP